MAAGKHKVRKLTDEQYNEYIAALKAQSAGNAEAEKKCADAQQTESAKGVERHI